MTIIRYFSWVREQIGTSEEQRAIPEEVHNISELIGWLSAHGQNYQQAFADRSVIQAAIDHRHVGHDASIAAAVEIAFFPPVTGG